MNRIGQLQSFILHLNLLFSINPLICRLNCNSHMKISYHWLKNLIPLTESPEEIGQKLTQTGLEVENIKIYQPIKGGLEGLVIGEVQSCEKHPEADRLSITKVDVGADALLDIVCGAPNVAAGQKVVVATVGATLYPAEGEPLTIKKSKIRGAASEGMICSEDEIGLGQSHAGIMVLDTKLANGTPAAKYFNLESDAVFEIGLTPNRVDAASHFGVARDLKVLLNRKTIFPESVQLQAGNCPVKIDVADTELCPRYAGVVIESINIAPSPDWLKHRLQAIGLSPINNIVDATNFVLHELGHPLHAFDLEKIAGKTIVVRKAREGEKMTTIDGIERIFSSDDLLIADHEKPLAIAGVFGGSNSGISESTKAIFVESAYFNPTTVRKTSQRLGIKTDSSFRFERGADPNMPLLALQRAVFLIQQLAGGSVSAYTDVYPNPVANRQIEVRYDYLFGLTGLELEREELHRILEALEIEVKPIDNYGHPGFEESFLASIPPYRVDVERPADVAEEVLRIVGFDQVPLKNFASTAFISPGSDADVREDNQTLASQFLADRGFVETIGNSFVHTRFAGLLPELEGVQQVTVLNRLSEDLEALRTSPLFSGLINLSYNINRKQSNLKLFEFGKTYRKTESGDTKENYFLSLLISGNEAEASWQAKNKEVDYYNLAGVMADLFQKMGLNGVETKTLQAGTWAFGQEFVFRQKTIARVGRLAPKIAAEFDVKAPVWYAEIDWQWLGTFKPGNIVFQEISKFPKVNRDLSVVLDKAVTFDQIKKIALQANRKLIKETNVFDVYAGANIGEGKKSYSISFTLQDSQQTLTDDTIDKVMNRVMQLLESELGAVIRKG